ncbi:hypothetical protein [Agrobacterium tumefaciens]|uniref:hypothetical protein n=1 Tax=Agrobacterium tumefaciens TaxID=358 RepID=UPI0001FC5771|nr:hypothetical protein [Agrobacterium tumefaciens]ADY64426.1 hypothetical protein AGROH133_06172 [Agrobacterium tumefaciens]
MAYVQRNGDGEINGIYSNFQEGIAEEALSEDNQEVLAFLNPVRITDYENAIQNLVDSTAHERQFRDGVTLASYTASTKPKWAAEAQAFVAWRDNVWFYAYGELAKVQAGQRPQPTVEQFLGEIAPIAWPVAS